MTKRWKMEALAAIAVIVMMFAAAGGKAVAAWLDTMPAAEAETHEPFVACWATVMVHAPTHDGPGLRYRMTGSLPVGIAVEVVREQDGWCKCLTYLSADPVWVNGEYLEKAE